MGTLVAVLLIAAPSVAAGQARTSKAQFIQSIDRIMVGLAPQSAEASRAIRKAYAPQLDLLMLDKFADLEGALETGRVTPLPANSNQFNLAPRVDGPHPIGEKDLDHQHSYIAARPATLGLLLEVASRVKSGPLEITSLVRHGDYQNSLASSNANANTAVPMHTMGLAFDIALVNTPLNTIREIRDVLKKMRDAGDLMFIGERRQLVFHVVPHPARIAHFADVYNKRVGVPSQLRGAHVIAAAPPTRSSGEGKKPRVTTEVIAILPTDEFATEWWIGETPAHSHDHEPVVAAAAARVLPDREDGSAAGVLPARRSAEREVGTGRLLMVIAGFVGTLVALGRQQRDQLRRQRRTKIFNASDSRRVAVEP